VGVGGSSVAQPGEPKQPREPRDAYVIGRDASAPVDAAFRRLVEARAGTAVGLCYQCRKCTAGCPVAEVMDHPPGEVVRLAQLGQRTALLGSSAIWLCAGCETCAARCPNNVNIPAVMDVLREEAIAAGVAAAVPQAQVFHESFLAPVRAAGRQYEAGMLVLYKAVSLDVFSDLGVGVKMLAKGKIPLLPKRVRGLRQVRGIFARSAGGGGRDRLGGLVGVLRHLPAGLRRAAARVAARARGRREGVAGR
jgi:heterodisulfide reductase subunit C